MFDQIRQGLCSVRSRIDGTPDHRIPKFLIAVADKGIGRLYHIRIQCCPNRQWFYCRSRLERITDTIVLPDAVQCFQHRSAILVFHFLDLFVRIIRREISRIIQIVWIVGCHGKDLTVFRIGYHHANIGGSLFSSRTVCHTGHKLVDIFFYYLLDIQVNR